MSTTASAAAVAPATVLSHADKSAFQPTAAAGASKTTTGSPSSVSASSSSFASDSASSSSGYYSSSDDYSSYDSGAGGASSSISSSMSSSASNSSAKKSSTRTRSKSPPTHLKVEAREIAIDIPASAGAAAGPRGALAEKNPKKSKKSSDEPAVELAWEGVTVQTTDGKKALLQDVFGASKGRLLAVLGSSGAGKTTLLNLLSGRLSGAKIAQADHRIAGSKYDRKVLKAFTGYVLQDDLLFAHLTVKETLMYAANLRMPATTSMEEREERITEVIARLGLQNATNTIVGDSFIKGISGGERKRLCVAIELLASPKILLLDEPTCGLDSSNAFALVRILHNLAHEENCTVVCSVHQPTSSIFPLFDDLLVLDRGKVVYSGPVDKVVDHYAKVGFVCPPDTNPADFIIEVITPMRFEDMQITEKNAERLTLEMQKSKGELHTKSHPGSLPALPKRHTWFQEFRILYHRALHMTLRNRTTILVQLLQSIFISIIIGFAFYDIGNTQYSVKRRQPLLFFCVINSGLSAALLVVNSFPSERAIVIRERSAGAYGASAYFLSKIFAELSVQVIYPAVFSTIVYWLSGLDRDVKKFFIFMGFIELQAMTMTAMAVAVTAICRTTSLSLSTLPLFLELTRLFGGFFVPPNKVPHYFSWLDAISPVKYAYVGVSLNELTGLKTTCLPKELVHGTCPVTTGEQQIEKFGFNYISMWGCALSLIGMMLTLRIIAYLALRFRK